MLLPSFISSRNQKKQSQDSSVSSNEAKPQPFPRNISRATRTRLIWTLISSLLFLVTVIFLILVEVGNTNGSSIRGSIYFIKLDLSQIIPASVPDAILINSIARTIGLHDFYQVGLWNFCEGYTGDGITGCSKPKLLYWFNPIEIILSELLAGATIALPTSIISALNLIRTASHWMSSLFLIGAVLSFVSIPFAPLSVYSRWAALPISLLTFLAALTTTAATVIATVMFLIFQNVLANAAQIINIGSKLGVKMFVFMWIASGCAIVGTVIQMMLCCCCRSRRDVKRGFKKRNKKVEEATGRTVQEKGTVRRRWGRKD